MQLYIYCITLCASEKSVYIPLKVQVVRMCLRNLSKDTVNSA